MAKVWRVNLLHQFCALLSCPNDQIRICLDYLGCNSLRIERTFESSVYLVSIDVSFQERKLVVPKLGHLVNSRRLFCVELPLIFYNETSGEKKTSPVIKIRNWFHEMSGRDPKLAKT